MGRKPPSRFWPAATAKVSGKKAWTANLIKVKKEIIIISRTERCPFEGLIIFEPGF
jgi:hypothetical protein